MASFDARSLRFESLEDRRMLASYAVDSIADAGPGTLREAVLLANASVDVPDEIVFAPALSGATISLTSGQLEVTDALTIDASALPAGVTIDATHSSRHFQVSETRLTVERLKLTDGQVGEGEDGGAIWSDGEVHLIDSTLAHNSARYGGAVYSEDGTLIVAGILFYRNFGSLGGAVYVSGNRTTTEINNSTFSENLTGFRGGALYATGSFITQLDINNSTLLGNRIGGGEEDPFLDLESNQNFDAIYEYNVPFTPPRAGQLRNSIVDGKVDGMSPVDTFFTSTGSLTKAFYYGDTRFDVQPLLTPLMDHGGPTLTYAPLPGSPLIDVRDPADVTYLTDFDQRGEGFHRIADGGSGAALLDIGANEAQAAALPGDINGDDHVNAADYTLWRDNLGSVDVAPHTLGDADGNGNVDARDYDVFRAHYGMFHATSLVVNDLADDDDGDLSNGRTTLREATRAADEAFWLDTITFDPSLSGGVIEATAQRNPNHLNRVVNYYIEYPLTIDATALPEGLTIRDVSSADDDTLFHINPISETGRHHVDVTIAGLTLEGSQSQLIRSRGFGELTLREVELRHEFSAVASAGPIHLIDSNVVDGTDGTFTGASRAALISQSSVELTNSTIVGANGDGVWIEAGAGGFASGHLDFGESPPLELSVRLIDSFITGSAGRGINGSGDVYLERSHIDGNLEGGIWTGGFEFYFDGQTYRGGAVTAVDSTVSDNTAPIGPIIEPNERRGGAGIVAARDVSLIRSRVENNSLDDIHRSTGGGITTWQSVTLVDSVVAGNVAEQGGGIYALGFRDDGQSPDSGDLAVSILGSSVSNNTSMRGGSGIQSEGSILVEQSSVSSNTVLGEQDQDPSAALLMTDREYSGEKQLTIVDSVVAANAFEEGSRAYAVYVEDGEATVNGSQIIDNQSGGIFRAASVIDNVVSRNDGIGINTYTTDATISGSTISGNIVGIVSDFGTLQVTDSVVRGNSSTGSHVGTLSGFSGAGIVGNRVFLERTTIAENVLDFREASQQPLFGGGAGISARFVYALDSAIRDNHVYGDGGYGGGVRGEFFRAYNTTISGNTTDGANASGGGVHVSREALLYQSTISGNQTLGTDSPGGGVYAETIEAIHSTIIGNGAVGAGSAGGGLYATGASTLHGTIVAGSHAAAGGVDVSGPAEAEVQLAYTLLGDSTGANITSSEGALLDVDPLLGPLQQNGGPTLSHAPIEGSPVVNAGDPALPSIPIDSVFGMLEGITDQRGEGFPRITDGDDLGVYRIDIGAYEAPAILTGSVGLARSPLKFVAHTLASPITSLDDSPAESLRSRPALEAAFTILAQSSIDDKLPRPMTGRLALPTPTKDFLLLILTHVANNSERIPVAIDPSDTTNGSQVDETDRDEAWTFAIETFD